MSVLDASAAPLSRSMLLSTAKPNASYHAASKSSGNGQGDAMLHDQASAKADFEPDSASCCAPAAISNESRGNWLARVIMPLEPWLRMKLRRKYPAADLDDVVQAAYVRLMATERTDHISDARHYFYRVAVSEIIEQARREQLVAFEITDFRNGDWEADEPAAEQAFDAKRALARLSAAIGKLPLRQRIAIKLRRIDGVSARQAAKQMAASVSSIEKYQTKAMRELSDAMRLYR